MLKLRSPLDAWDSRGLARRKGDDAPLLPFRNGNALFLEVWKSGDATHQRMLTISVPFGEEDLSTFFFALF